MTRIHNFRDSEHNQFIYLNFMQHSTSQPRVMKSLSVINFKFGVQKLFGRDIFQVRYCLPEKYILILYQGSTIPLNKTGSILSGFRLLLCRFTLGRERSKVEAGTALRMIGSPLSLLANILAGAIRYAAF